MKVYVSGVSVLGPGLAGWQEARRVLAGEQPYRRADLVLPVPEILPPNERRRTSLSVRLAIMAALQACAAAGLDPSQASSVFATSNGDGQVIAAILETLCGTERLISPTQFHNSVHNAAAGYWSIATGCTRASTSIGGHDFTFAAGLLKAAAEALSERRPVLLCAYDAPMAPPLSTVRPTEFPFAIGMVLSAGTRGTGEPQLRIRYIAEPPSGRHQEPEAEALRALHCGNPAARSLRLLEALARREEVPVSLAFLADARVDVSIAYN